MAVRSVILQAYAAAMTGGAAARRADSNFTLRGDDAPRRALSQ